MTKEDAEERAEDGKSGHDGGEGRARGLSCRPAEPRAVMLRLKNLCFQIAGRIPRGWPPGFASVGSFGRGAEAAGGESGC